jgi:hypothetical protein
MLDANAPATLLTADQAVEKIKNNILSNAQPHLWLTSYIQMNQVTLTGLIENDTFGDLSEFDEENPAPAPLEQVKILQAFIKKENQSGPYDVKAITALLKGFIERTADQQRTIDNLLLNAQLARTEGWFVSLPVALDVQLCALNNIQILNKMERMLDAIEQETQDKTDLKLWVNQSRTQIANNSFDFRNLANVIELPYFLAGADQLSKFIRNEIQAILSLYYDTRTRILSISEFTPRRLINHVFGNLLVDGMNRALGLLFDVIKLPFGLLYDGVVFAIRMGLFALLPYRFALTLCREAVHQVEKGIRYVARKFLPERFEWMAYVLAFVAVCYLGLGNYYESYFSEKMLWGFQIFPASWSWNFIGKLALGFSVSELALGIGKFCKSIWDRRAAAQPAGVPGPVVLIPAEQLDAEPVAAPIPAPAANDIGIPLNPEQKKKLQLLLMRENMSVDGNQDMPAEKKAKKKGKLGTEQIKLHDTTTAYTLSKMDKKLLAKQAALPAGFENLEAEIRAVAPTRASAG